MTAATKRDKLPSRAPRSPAESLLFALKRKLAERVDGTWEPFAKYIDDPVGFARDILGATLWSKQILILRAIAAGKRVSVRSGHKVSKSHTAAIIALWWYCTRDDARVVMTSVTHRQVERILWRELCKMKSKSRLPIPGHAYEKADSGIKSHDFREIVGFTAKEPEAVAGVSGANLLYILDEASGIDDLIFEAIEGNRAGGARLIMFSNPTRTEGEFFASHHEKKEFYTCIAISSEETPNVVERREVIPGLAGHEWIDEKKREWGEDSPLYKVRVKGEFVLHEDGKILSVHAIAQAENRWDDADANGLLCIGLDPAGPGLAGDEGVFAMRRNLKALEFFARRGLDANGYLVSLIGLIKQHKRFPGEVPRVVMDRDGPIGAKVYGVLVSYLQNERREVDFQLVGVRSGERATRQPKIYDRIRDELWASLAEWIKSGGGIPENAKLAKELHAPEWIGQVTGRLKVTDKDDLRKMLGRSPDHADSLALSCWEAENFHARIEAQIRDRNAAPAEARIPQMDPYAAGGGGVGSGGRGMDPYG